MRNIASWTEAYGFRFSSTKTKMMHFSNREHAIPPPVLFIDQNQIKTKPVKEIKFLGLYLDSRLNWKAHVEKIREYCRKSVNILRSLTATEWGADRETLLHQYRAMVRSRMDYGSIVYGAALEQTLKPLDTIANEFMGIATGAMKTIPIQSLQTTANEKPLALRRKELTLKYYFKMSAQLKNPVYTAAVTPQHVSLFKSYKGQADHGRSLYGERICEASIFVSIATH